MRRWQTVCALAELPRATLNSKFMNDFSSFLDIVPCTRVAISSFCHGNYQVMTQVVGSYVGNCMYCTPLMLLVSCRR